ncbi:MAG TPA: SMI1/KNR4 family protein, partial [Cellvibrio sp.]|nr:SMI1/KNR4 family protein [Cellvibrio sp.]
MKIGNCLIDWPFNDGASDFALQEFCSSLHFSLPNDYVEFLRRSDGGEGFVNDNYLILWKLGELKVFNEEYEVDEYAPGIFLFGSNGGGEGYGFDLRSETMKIVSIPFIGMDLDCAIVVASDFTSLF